MMHLVRLLVFFAARYNFWFSVTHIPGRLNSQADAILRNHVDQFLAEVPLVSPSPSPISPSMMKLLSPSVTWLWIQLFKAVTST